MSAQRTVGGVVSLRSALSLVRFDNRLCDPETRELHRILPAGKREGARGHTPIGGDAGTSKVRTQKQRDTPPLVLVVTIRFWQSEVQVAVRRSRSGRGD